MSPSDFIAALALVVSGASLGLEVRRWFENGPKLRLSLIADAIEIPSNDESAKLVITVTNRGNEPTTITNMIVFAKHPWWQFWRRKPMLTGIVNSTIQNIPFEVGTNQRWMGRMLYDERTEGYRADGQLYVGVIASHSNWHYLVRVPRKKPELPAHPQASDDD